MSKCALDIKKDIIDAAAKRLTAKGAYVFEDNGYFSNPNIASSVINDINKEFGDLLVKEGDKGSFFIDPSEKLVNAYLDYYNRTALQLNEETATSAASPKTIALLKQLIKAIGVDIKQVKNITVNGQKMDANGAAMLMQKIIQVVEGKEAQALPEEAMHFVVEIIKQTNPALYKKLLGEVNNYRLTSQVFAEYSKLPGYQTKDGKPNVAKIKDEAIAKILTETVINQNEGSTEKPENLAKAQSWWDAIVDWFKNLFAKSGFDQLAMDVLSGKISGTAEDIRAAEDAVFFQISPQERTINKIKEVSSRIEKRDDGYYIDGKKINRRVTDLVNDWYSRRFNNNELTKSEFQTAVDDLKAEKGTAGHKDIEYAFYTLVDENGLLRTTPLDDSGYVSQLNPNNRDMYDLLKANLAERLKSLDKNGKTKFLSEITVYDAKRGLAGTIDFVAIDEDGKTSVLDWKFMDINVEKTTDVPWYKVNAWNTQMEQYVQILEQVYGVKRKDFVQTRMIPIQAIYSKGNAKQNILPELLNVRIGDVNVQNIKDDFLIPVGLESEKTGDPLIDSYLEKLNALYRKLSEKKVLPSERLNKNEQLNALFTAIRQLQMVRNIKPIIYQAKILNKQIQQTIDTFNTKFAGQDPKSFTDREITDFAQTIETAQEALDIYVDLYSTLKSVFGATPTEEQEKILTDLNKASDKAKDFQFALNNISNKFVDEIIAKSVGVEGILTPEKTVKGFTRLFATTANLQITSIGALYRKANKAFALAGFDTLSENKKLQELKKNYDAWARSKGLANKNYFDIIKKKDSNELIDEFNPEFYKELKKHVQDKDYQWIRENIDVDAYRKFLDEKLVEEIERIENKARLGTDEEIAAEIKREKFKAEQLMTTDDATAPGWLLYDFVKRFPKKEKWESAEWKKLTAKGNEAAKAFYDYIREKNEEYRQVGYINAATARVFLPFVRKSLMEKIVTGGKTKLMDQFIRDISIDEGDLGYGQIDPLTGRPVDKIPKYFIREVEGELSTDLFRTMALYNEAAIKYKYLSEIEDQVRAIVKLERNKKAIQTSIFSTPVMEDGKPKLVKHNDDNAQLVEDMMKAIIYGQKYLESESFDQVLGTMGQWGETLNKKLGVNIFPEGLSGRQLSVNKIIHQLNTNFQITTLGLNPLSATSNFFGGNAQSIINAGTYFTKTDYLASEGMVLQRKFIGTDKKLLIGALEYFLPLTENYNREIAKKLSLNKLSQENIQDFLMILMRESDLHVQTANFYAFLNNTIVQDGKVVNAREFLRAQPKYADRYKGTSEERKALEKEFEKEVKQLVEEKGVLKVAKIENNEFVIPGVDRKDDSVVELRRKVQQISKDALGNLSEDDQRKINMTVYGKSFMVFKNWIPRLVDVRFGNLKYNWASDAYEWGRTRTLFRFLYEDTSGAFSSLKSAILGNDERYIQQIRKLYEKKKADYEKDTGKELKMDEAMFIDLVRQNIRNQAYDLMFYMTLWALVAGLKALAPDDEDETVRNQYKFLMRASDKLFDEIGFFYSPTGGVFQTISKGIFPSITLLDNAEKTFSNFMMENYYIATGDEEMAEKNFVIKYAMKTFPFTNQMTNYLPMFYPDLAKDLGIKVQSNYGIR